MIPISEILIRMVITVKILFKLFSLYGKIKGFWVPALICKNRSGGFNTITACTRAVFFNADLNRKPDRKPANKRFSEKILYTKLKYD